MGAARDRQARRRAWYRTRWDAYIWVLRRLVMPLDIHRLTVWWLERAP